ncbi:MAG: S-layer homology domain-containing protein, partial [Actinomyces sp.]
MSLWSTRTAITLRGVLAGVLIGGLVAGGVAAASVSFDDVPSGKFYEAPVEWAKANNITTGSPAGSRTFKPEDPVTRGESVTFLKRYDDNIVQPALANKADAADTYTKAEVDA